MVDLFAPGTLPLLLVIAGVALSLMEAIAPGAHFVVLGSTLIVAGIAGLLYPPLGTPLALAGMVLAVGGGLLWAYRNLDIYGGAGTAQTNSSETLAGREGVVIERVTQTGGRVRLYDGGFDPTFSARALEDPIPEGATILVVDPGGGSVLTVENIEAIEADSIDQERPRDRSGGNDPIPDSEA
ncbi:MAG: NfeD family protein [Halobacteriaceae archaeon]